MDEVEQPWVRAARGTERLVAPISEDPPDELESVRATLADADRFIGALGHELRNAIAPLDLLVQQLEGGAPLMDRHLRRFLETIDRIADLGHLRQGRLRLKLSHVELGAVVREVCAAVQREGCAVELRLAIAPGATGLWDRARLAHLIENLIKNAIRHSRSPLVEIEVSSSDTEAVLVVTDHGIGIAAPLRASLFDRFSHPAARASGGLGMGLWTTRQLCRAMGGDCTLAETEQPGARFRVVLPRG